MGTIMKKHTTYHNGRGRAAVQMHDDLWLQIKTISLNLINVIMLPRKISKTAIPQN